MLIKDSEIQSPVDYRFLAIVEQSPMSIQIMSPEGYIVQVNKAWEELWGVTLDQLQGYNILKDKQLEENGMMPYIKRAFDGQFAEIPLTLYDPDETIPNITRHTEPKRWIKAVIYPIKNSAGQVQEVVLLHEDITAQKQTEKKIKDIEARYRSLLENANDIIYSHDLQGNYVAVNSAAEKITGYSWEELREMNIAQLVVPEHHELVKQIIERKLYDPTPTVYELDIITKDGRRRTLEVNPRISSIEGQPLVIEGVARDVTERKHLEEVRHNWAERLEAAREDERRRLSLQLHDEVVQQLAVASIKLQRLEKKLVKLLPDENAVFADLVMTQELLRRNQRSLRQMAHVLHSGVLVQFGLAEAFRKFTKDIDTLLLKQSTAISLNLSPDFPRLESAIENGIYRTVQEAIINALKHARAKLISLSLDIKDDLALVIIRDDGCGFDLKKIESNGIGFASMYERAEIIGAKLNVTSQNGRGTTISLEVPLKQSKRKASSSTGEYIKRLASGKILLRKL